MQENKEHKERKEHKAQTEEASSGGISDLFIRRPVTTVMMALAIMVVGTIGYKSMGVDLYPNVEFPFATVQTTLPGASAEEIETSITKQTEEAVNVISGIEELSSMTMEGVSFVIVQFELEKNADVAVQEVRDKINKIQKDLPDGTDPPVVSKLDAGAIPVINIVVSSDTMNIIELTELAKKSIKENIENVSGIGSVNIVGGREREIHVVVNPLKLASLGLSVSDIKKAIQDQNIEIPGGRVENIAKDFNLRVLGRITDVKDFSDIVVGTVNGVTIKISDIGRVEDDGEYERSASFINGNRSVSLSVVKQSGTNTLAVVNAIKERLKGVETLLPAGVKIDIVSDQSGYIEASFFAVMEHLIVGAFLAALVVFMFMGDVRSTLISAVAIPTSIIGTFALMKASSFTLNNMTLLGLTVAVGIVIDDAIIMLENIHRHMEEYGKSAMQAAIDGSREISFAIIATTASLIVIFVPLAFMGGIVGRFVKSYGLTVAYAIAISGLVALTVTPMLCSRFLKKENKSNKTTKMVDGINNSINGVYIKMLEWAMHHRKTMVTLSLILIITPVLFFAGGLIGVDFLTEDDSGKLQVVVEAPDGTSYKQMSDFMGQISKEIQAMPYVDKVFTAVGASASSILNASAESKNGYFIVELEDLKHRGKGYSIFDYIRTIRGMMSKYDNVKSSVEIVSGSPGGGQAKIPYIITGPDMDKLLEYATAVYDAIKAHPGFIDQSIDFNFSKPEYRVVINREKAHDLGVKLGDLASTLRTLVGGEEDISKYKEGGELYEIRVRADEKFRNNPDAISAMMVPATRNGKPTLVRLDSVATVEEGFGPAQINRQSRQRSVTINTNTAEGFDMQSAIRLMDETFKAQNPPASYRAMVVGQAKEMGRMITSFIIAFGLAILFKYMILASQFESFVLPLVVLTAIPLAIPFALLTLVLTRETLNIFSLLGVFMLIGIVSKNSILQVDYTNTLRSKGYERYKAIMEANKVRLRPILMTTVTIIAGMVPTALGTGAGSGLRKSLAIVIIGGQTFSLLITLLMVPVTYSLLEDLSDWFKKKYAKQ